MIGKRMRHLHRYREIVTCLVRNGFGFVVEELGLWGLLSLPKRFFGPTLQEEEERSVGVRFRLVFEQLGPTFIKLGQLLSTRSDILPDYIILELHKLQDAAPPFSFSEVEKIITEELGGRVGEVFSHFEETPLAAASIGQVHRARLKAGEEVVVKIQRPQISKVVETDLEILEDLAILAEHRLEVAKHYNLREIVEDFAAKLRAELNYTLEARNAQRFARIFAQEEKVTAPAVFWEYTTKRVITLEYLKGIKVDQIGDLVRAGYDREVIARRLTKAYLHQVLVSGYFHADPHPGNLMVLPGEVLAFTDFGLMGTLSREVRGDFTGLLLAVMGRDTSSIVKAALRIGKVPDDVDMNRLTEDVDQMVQKYYHLPLKQVSIGDAVHDFFRVAYRHRIQIPTNLALLGKTFFILESLLEKLDPELSVMELVRPFRKELLKARLDPKELTETFWRNLSTYGELLLDLPRELLDMAATVKRGRLRLEIGVPELDRFLRKMDRIGNRLSFSIVLLSFSIIMAGLIIGSSLGAPPLLLATVPAIEVGFAIATVMFFWLLLSIFRSGRF